jgi:hypothetical protein
MLLPDLLPGDGIEREDVGLQVGDEHGVPVPTRPTLGALRTPPSALNDQ